MLERGKNIRPKIDYIEAVLVDAGTLHVGLESRLKEDFKSIEVIRFNAILEATSANLQDEIERPCCQYIAFSIHSFIRFP